MGFGIRLTLQVTHPTTGTMKIIILVADLWEEENSIQFISRAEGQMTRWSEQELERIPAHQSDMESRYLG